MAKSLGSAQDIQQTSASMESGGQSLFLSIPDAKTPWRLLGLDYVSFFTHWYGGVQGQRSVVCAGGVDGGGFATDDCPICEHVLELYQEGKRLREDGDEIKGNKLKNKANDLRGKASVVVKAIRGQYVLYKDPKTGKKVQEADFEIDDDNEDSNVEIGLLSLSQAQWDGLIGMINGENTSFITDGADLAKHVLFTKKERRKGKTTKFTAVVWGAEKEETDLPDIEIPKEVAEVDLDELAVIDTDEVQKVADFLNGQSSEDVDDDEEVETIDDDSDDDDVDDSYLDDVDDDEEEDPGEDDEDEIQELDETEVKKPAPRKKASAKKPDPKKKPAAKKPVSKSTAPKKSGKTRL